MDLILWRHAEAEDGVPDGERALTKKGRKQAAALAAWLNERLPKRPRILVSPAVRAQQTAAALGQAFTTAREIGVGASAASSSGVSARTCFAGLSSRRPWNDPCRT